MRNWARVWVATPALASLDDARAETIAYRFDGEVLSVYDDYQGVFTPGALFEAVINFDLSAPDLDTTNDRGFYDLSIPFYQYSIASFEDVNTAPSTPYPAEARSIEVKNDTRSAVGYHDTIEFRVLGGRSPIDLTGAIESKTSLRIGFEDI
ncbi:MAG: hypothetical protein ACYSX0_17995, partial [Planctomycetota bacterium]